MRTQLHGEKEKGERERSNYTRQRKMSREGKGRGRRATYAPSNTSLAEREKAMLSWRRSMEKKRARKREGARSTQDVEKRTLRMSDRNGNEIQPVSIEKGKERETGC